LGICENEKYRGQIMAAGGAKALIPLALDGTQVGKIRATQALAKIAITTNPELAFPGQRVRLCFIDFSNLFSVFSQMLEVVRPVIKLLHIDNSTMENFEALMALTNLAGVGENVRKRILKEDGFAHIEQYMYEDHPMLRRAATECMCNLVNQEEVIKYFTAENDRVKLLILLCGEEDDILIKASLGTLATLSFLQLDMGDYKLEELPEEDQKKLREYIDDNRIICEKILDVNIFHMEFFF